MLPPYSPTLKALYCKGPDHMSPGFPPITKTVQWAILTAVAAFFTIALILLPYPGLQNDECLFVQPLYGPVAPADKIHLFRHDLVLMLMSYLGTAKTLIYLPVFKFFAPSVWSIRLPGLFTGAATIWMFGLLLFRMAGPFAAIAGSFLLALDPSYVLTTVFDWGPVAIQHCALVAGVLALHYFHDSGSKRMLSAGFFSFGFGMWDKALFSWMLAGLVVASLIFLSPQIRRHLTPGNAVVVLAAFLAGAAPLIIYNVRNNLETFRGNAKMNAAEIWPKTVSMPHTLDGSGLFGYLVHEEWDDSPRAPQNAIERFSTAVRRIAGIRRQGWLPQALLAVLFCFPFWRRRWMPWAFALVVGVVAWLLMAATSGAGGSVHHVVLLWPVPQFLVAFGVAVAIENRRTWWRWGAALLIGLVCAQNVLVTNQYLYNLQRWGAGSSWTDAIFPLSEALGRIHPEHVNLMDWGFEFNLMALSQGVSHGVSQEKTDIRWGAEPGEHLKANENDQRLLGVFLESADQSVWVKHVEPIEVTPGSERRFTERALERGYEKKRLELVPDRNGREMFEIYRFVKVKP